MLRKWLFLNHPPSESSHSRQPGASNCRAGATSSNGPRNRSAPNEFVVVAPPGSRGLLLAALERPVRELEAGEEKDPPESAEAPEPDAQRPPWWRRMFGGG